MLKLRYGMFCILFVSTGCAQIYNCVDGHLIDCRDRIDAKMAWHRCKPDWKHVHFRRDFADGFKSGYFDGLQGGGECPPVLPPRKYWSVHNRGPDSEARVVAWFDGYMMGSAEALIDGSANRGRVLTSAEIYGRFGKQPEVVWPDNADVPAAAPPPSAPPATEPGLVPPVIPDQALPTLPEAHLPAPLRSPGGALQEAATDVNVQ
ncbi:MAG: hypothetical protein ACF8TS_20800 [Maioricimonas sp. JB049]